jgi:hypothetical protein
MAGCAQVNRDELAPDILPGECDLGIDIVARGRNDQAMDLRPARGAVLSVFWKPQSHRQLTLWEIRRPTEL